jgi:hypothetical protein
MIKWSKKYNVIQLCQGNLPVIKQMIQPTQWSKTFDTVPLKFTISIQLKHKLTQENVFQQC